MTDSLKNKIVCGGKGNSKRTYAAYSSILLSNIIFLSNFSPLIAVALSTGYDPSAPGFVCNNQNDLSHIHWSVIGQTFRLLNHKIT